MTGITQLFLDIKKRILSLASFTYTKVFTGSGLNDAGFLGDYTGATPEALSATYIVTIDATGAIDTFTVTTPTTTITGVAITGTRQWLDNGISVQFLAVTGHTAGNSWTLTIEAAQTVKFCQVWNNQTTFEAEGQMYDYPKPAVFIEFANLEDIQQLGNGNQIYNDILVRLHIVQEFYNATDGLGIEEQNLTIFDLTQAIFKGLNRFEPTGAAAMVRTAEGHKSDHNNIYEFIQDYKTNLIDLSLDAPVGFVLKPGPTGYVDEIFVSYPATPDLEFITSEKTTYLQVNNEDKMFIDWGDGNKEEVLTTGYQAIPHTYATPGLYVVKVRCKSIIEVVFSESNNSIYAITILPEAVVDFTLGGSESNLASVNAGNLKNCNAFTCTDSGLLNFSCAGLINCQLVVMENNHKLNTFDATGLEFCTQLNLRYGNLSSSQVDDILQKMDTYGKSAGTITTYGQTPPAPPTAAGLLAKANLQAKGYTVDTD